jgi:hypothetical protein
MIKTELLKKYGITGVFDMNGLVDYLFSFTELDPMFWAESDGYNFADGKPFKTMAYIGPGRNVVVTVIVFEDYLSKAGFEESGVVLLHE